MTECHLIFLGFSSNQLTFIFISQTHFNLVSNLSSLNLIADTLIFNNMIKYFHKNFSFSNRNRYNLTILQFVLHNSCY